MWISCYADTRELSRRYAPRVRPLPTAPVAAGSLIVGFAVAEASGSRPLGGAVMLVGGLWCIRAWTLRHGSRTAVELTCVAFAAFVISHVLGLLIGAWPSVLVVSAFTAVITWLRADSRLLEGDSEALAFRRPAR
jgi:hypothetical protein